MDTQQMSSYADGTKAAHMDLSAPSDTAEWRSVRARHESTHLIMSSSPRLSPFDAYIWIDQLRNAPRVSRDHPWPAPWSICCLEAARQTERIRDHTYVRIFLRNVTHTWMAVAITGFLWLLEYVYVTRKSHGRCTLGFQITSGISLLMLKTQRTKTLSASSPGMS
jgi:hypothetical protein